MSKNDPANDLLLFYKGNEKLLQTPAWLPGRVKRKTSQVHAVSCLSSFCFSKIRPVILKANHSRVPVYSGGPSHSLESEHGGSDVCNW